MFQARHCSRLADAARLCLACLQAFLDMKQLMAHLEGILRQCRELCTLVQVRALCFVPSWLVLYALRRARCMLLCGV